MKNKPLAMIFNRFQSLSHLQLLLVLIVPQMLPVQKEVPDIHLAWNSNSMYTLNLEETARNTVLFFKRTGGNINYFCRNQPVQLFLPSFLQSEFQVSSLGKRLDSASKISLTAGRGFAVAQEDAPVWNQGVDHLVDRAAFVEDVPAWDQGVDHLVDMAAFVAHYSKTTRVGFVALCIQPDVSKYQQV